MKADSFEEYCKLREASENNNDNNEKESKDSNDGALATKVSLGDGNDYKPFFISDDQHSENYGKNKNLAPVVRAFKHGANWGWSKDEKSGEDKPVKIGGKKLYLVGGAVRDHLVGKKPRNIELATNSSPDEVYHILKQNEFEFCPDKKAKDNQNCFWVNKTDKNKRPFSFGLSVNGEEFDLDIFTKTPKGNVEIDPESGTHAQDASGRDFTMNAMAILLSNDNGPNKELSDFYGGIHDLASGKISAVGDMKKKFSEDPSRLMRYVRMVNSYGDPKKISSDDKDVIKNSAGGLKKLKPEDIMGEFKKGLQKDDTNSRKYLSIFRDLGLLDSMFPGKVIDVEFPKELDELSDKMMPVAWMLRNNNPDALGDTGLDPESLSKISFLIKSLGLSENINPSQLNDLLNGYQRSGVTSRKLKEWLNKIGHVDGEVTDAFIHYSGMPRVKVYINEDGSENVAPEFQDIFDPFTGEPNQKLLEDRKKSLEYKQFLKELEFMKPN